MRIMIDGKPCEAEAGQFILGVAKQNGIEIPTLCDHAAFPGRSCCRLCIVEVETPGEGRSVVVSCVYPIKESIAVYTNTEKIIRLRRNILALLKARAPKAEGALASYCAEYGVSGADPRFGVKDNEKCVLCGLCIRACDELGNAAIAAAMRGIDKRVMAPFDEPSPDCMGCASCANICPTHAIECCEDGDTRAIWGKEFRLLRCAACGRPYATAEEMEWLKGRLLDTELNLGYCPRCRGRASINA